MKDYRLILIFQIRNIGTGGRERETDRQTERRRKREEDKEGGERDR